MSVKITQKKLDNGVRAYYIGVNGSKRSQVRLIFKAGFQYFNKSTYHVPHLLEHLLLSGGGSEANEDELISSLQQIGATANASTDHKYISVVISAPARNTDKAVLLVLDSIYSLRKNIESLIKEKKIIEREVHEQHDAIVAGLVNYLSSKIAPDLFYEAWVDQLPEIDKIAEATLLESYRNYIQPTNCVAVAAGPQSREIATRLFKIFSNQQPTSKTVLPKAIESSITATKTEPVQIDMGPNGSIVKIWESTLNSQSSYRVKLVASVALTLLFRMPASRLPKKLRDTGSIYSMNTDSLYLGDKTYIVLSIFADKENLHRALLELSRQIKSYALGVFGQGELESTKEYIISSLETAPDTPSRAIEWYLGDILNDRKFISVEDEIEFIKSITTKEISEYIEKDCNDSNYLMAITSSDSAFWTDGLDAVQESISKAKDTDELNDVIEKSQSSISKIRQAAPVFYGYGWVAFFWAGYASLVACIFGSFIQMAGRSEYSGITDLPMPAIAYVLTSMALMVLAGAMGYINNGKKEKIAQLISIALYLMGGASFAYFFLKFTTGFDGITMNNPGSLLALVPVIFSFVLCPLALGAVLLRVINNIKK